MGQFADYLTRRRGKGYIVRESERGEPMTRRPGQHDDAGSAYEPEHEPELGNFIMNRALSTYPDGNTEELGFETGYVLPDGSTVPMGMGGIRGDDHRSVLPTSDAMRRWGWGEEMAKGAENDTRTPALYELMRRSGAVRVIVTRQEIVIHHLVPLTRRQKMTLLRGIERLRPKSVLIRLPNRKEVELDPKEPWELEPYLGG